LIAEHASSGLGVIVVSSDFGDLVALCSRVLVLSRGEVACQLVAEEISELNLIHATEDIENEMAQ
jgi:ABC-type sugar transport system ATPase subunit